MASRVIHDKIPHNVRVNKGVTVAAPKRPQRSMDSILRQTYEDIALADRCAAVQDSNLRGSALKTIKQLVVRKALNSKAVAAIHDDGLRDAVNAIIKPFGIQQGYANENALNRLFAGRRAIGQDAVAPSTKGVSGVKPSTIGIAAQKRFTELAKVAAVTGDFLSTLNKFRASQDAAENPQFAALLDDPKLMAVIQRVVAKIGKEVAAMIAADKGADYPETGVNNQSSPTGMDAARPILTAENMELMEKGRANLSRLRTAEALGDPGDIVRARLGMDARPATADDLFALGREGTSKFSPRG